MQTTIDRDRYERLHAFARKVVIHDPEDLVQDAWLRELEHPDAHTDAYLQRSLKYRWRARHRSDSRRRRRESAWTSEGSENVAVPAELLALDRALRRLTIEQRRLIEARFIEGREPREIAEALGLAPEVVRQRLHRALVALRGELDGERRRVLIPLGWRRFAWPLAASVSVCAAIVGVVCSEPDNLESRPPTVVADERPSSTATQSEAQTQEADSNPEPASSGSEVAPSQSPGADSLGVAWLLRQYREGYGALMKEVQASFIGCVTEHNQDPPASPVEMTGKTVFRVQLRSEPDTGVFADQVDVREDTHAARDLVDCIGASLPTLAIAQPSLDVPAAVLVVVEKSAIMTTLELDLGGMPDDLRADVEQVRRIGRYLSKGQAPASAQAALADFALALADGIIEPGELEDEVWATLRELEDPPKP